MIVAISTELVVIPFLEVSFLIKGHAHGTDSLAKETLVPFHLLLGSTSWALAYAKALPGGDPVLLV